MAFERNRDRQVVKRAQLSLTPMIDVVFLLLIFFMVGMKFKELDRKLEADLPKTGKPNPQDTELVNEIWVRLHNDASGTLTQRLTAADNTDDSKPFEPFCRIVVDQVRMRSWQHVRETLQRLADAPGARADPVILAPDPDVPQRWVMAIFDILHELKFTNINFKQ